MRLIKYNLMDIDDFKSKEYLTHINEMHSAMKIKRDEENMYFACTDRVSFFERTRIEAYKHWEIPWTIIYSKVEPGSKVLDCGCGRSFFPVYLAKLGYNVSAVDTGTQKAKIRRKINKKLTKMFSWYTEDKTAAFKRISKRFNIALDFRCESIEKMSFESESFDAVFCISVLEHMPRNIANNCFYEMFRVLKPGGKLVVTVDYHPTSRPNNAYTTQDIKSCFLESKLMSETNSDIIIEIPDWEGYIKKVQKIFNKNNLHSTFGMIFEK